MLQSASRVHGARQRPSWQRSGAWQSTGNMHATPGVGVRVSQPAIETRSTAITAGRTERS